MWEFVSDTWPALVLVAVLVVAEIKWMCDHREHKLTKQEIEDLARRSEENRAYERGEY
jgi:hypothetical protein